MDIKLSKDTEQKLGQSIQRYMSDNFGDEIGELKASLFIKFILAEIAPSVYNHAIYDAQRYFQEKALDLENVCFAEEFGYWNKGGGKSGSQQPEGRR